MKNCFAENLKRLRIANKYTPESFAEKAKTSVDLIKSYEKGEKICNFDTLLLFADILGCSTDYLLKKQTTKGVIYILTNPSFPEYVKIGYADDVERRLQELNRSECVPFSFRVFATYAVNTRLSDKSVHAIIDKLNSDLRAIEVVKGKERKREFYAMTAEDAYLILEAIAEIHGYVDRLERVKPSEIEQKEEKEAQDIEKESRTRSNNFTFSEWQIPMGAILRYRFDPSITCKVVDERHVTYKGKKMYLTGVAKELLGKTTGVCGPDYFTYMGTKLWDIEGRKDT